VRLANNEIIYSAGRGSVLLQPDDTSLPPVLLTRVLHIPDLQNNLLSVLDLVTRLNVVVTIRRPTMRSEMAQDLLFTATMRENTAWLDVSVVTRAASELAGRVTLDRAAWHRRLGHVGADLLEKAIKHNLGEGLRLDSDAAPPALCVPCIHGKQL
jgi:hypothetical protein